MPLKIPGIANYCWGPPGIANYCWGPPGIANYCWGPPGIANAGAPLERELLLGPPWNDGNLCGCKGGPRCGFCATGKPEECEGRTIAKSFSTRSW